MRIYIFICLILPVVIASCTKKEIKPSVYKFEAVKSIEIVLEQSDMDYSDYDFVKIDNSYALIFVSGYKRLSFYSLETGKKFHEIHGSKDRGLQYFKFINKDSIYVFYHPELWGYDILHPGQFQLLDFEGYVKKTYQYKIDTSELSNRGYSIYDILPPTTSNLLADYNNVFFSPYRTKRGEIGTEEFMENKMPILMNYSTIEEKFHISKHENFPYIKEGDYYPSDFNIINYTMSEKGFPLIRFCYSSDVFEWDYKNDSLIRHSFKSRLCDTIMPLKTPTSASNNLEAYYIGNYYDPYRKLYFATIVFNNNIFGKTAEGGNLFSLVIANNSFEYLGEAFCPDYCPDFFTSEYAVDCSRKNDSVIQLTYLKMVKTKIDYDQYISSIRDDIQARKKQIEDFKASYGNDENYILKFLKENVDSCAKDCSVVTIYAQAGCLGCRQSVLSLIAQNRDLLETLNLYLVVTNNDSNVIFKELEEYGLNDYKKLVIDSLGIIRKMAATDEMLNPRLTIVKDNSVVLDSIYTTFDIEKSYIPALVESLGLKVSEN